MEPNTAEENSTTIPSIPSLSNVSTPTNQDQQQQQHQQQQQPIVQQEQQQEVEQNQNHQSLASHFHLSHLVESLGDAIDNGTRDQHSDALINELSNHFEKCQQLLNSIGASLSTKDMTVEEQNKKLGESEQLLNQRRDLIANFRSTVEDLVKSEP
ncbi:mediator of RNA polymerase II transcription subunit 9-like [Hibiscus syriacus]|uniref:mediator of RNA polymerase II transcription subunit 9-like n=1 Tax=Hibiscus syriacus TaxID=106335 RepID=UPI0019236F09|nr:mediator of RNA polymerase II transcription subunit 9-like [Hibiscus syriacus]